jgi:tetratricopeptide (TPR) repeat protein
MMARVFSMGVLFAGVVFTSVWAAGAATAQMYGGGSYGAPTPQAVPSPTGPRYDAAAEYRKGQAALKAGKYKEAITAFEHVLVMAPTNSNAWALLGLSKEGAGDLKGARAAYEKAVRYGRDSIVAHQLLGRTEGKLGDTAKAQAELEWLKKRSDACGGTCADAAALKGAIAEVEASLAPPSAPASAPQPASKP